MSEQEIRQIIRDELSFIIKNDKYVFEKLVQFLDGRNIQLGRANGTSIGTSADQKLSVYGETPIVQQGAISAPTGGLTVDSEARTAINSIRQALTNFGITS
jgi:hypothetical protein